MSKLNYFQTRPKLQQIPLEEYLDRLGISMEVPGLRFLKKIHKAHLFKVPFENLDIHYNKRIELNVKPIFEKVIRQKRGGFCYELNTLILHLLNQLGFKVYLASARVFQEEGLSPEFDHMIIILEWEEDTYLVDVGFGKLFVEPKKIIANQPQLDYTTYYKFEQDVDGHWLLKRSKDNADYKPIYQFDLQPRELIEFLSRCDFHQESPNSHFKQTKLITQLFHEGRVTLTDRELRLSLNGEYTVSPISNEDEFLARLEEYFQINTRALIRQQLG